MKIISRIFWTLCIVLFAGTLFGFFVDLNTPGDHVDRYTVLHPPTATPFPTLTPRAQPAQPTATSAPGDAPTALPTAAPAEATASTATAIPLPTAAPALPLEGAIRAALGDSNRGVARVGKIEAINDVLNVEWAINENLTRGMTRTGARMDAVAILAAARASGQVFRVINLTGSYSMIDGYGNAAESPVVRLGFSAETMGRINWADADYVRYLLLDTIYEIADSASVHQTFRE